MTNLDKQRRRFLALASSWAALGALYGCEAIFEPQGSDSEEGAEPSDSESKPPPVDGEAWRVRLPEAAVRAMGERGQGALAIVVPEDDGERVRLGEQLEELLTAFESFLTYENAGKDNRLAEWFAELVPVCVRDSADRPHREENVMVLDEQGNRLFGTRIEFGDFEVAMAGCKELIEREPFASWRASQVSDEELTRAVEVLHLESSFEGFADRERQAVVRRAMPRLRTLFEEGELNGLRSNLNGYLSRAAAGVEESRGAPALVLGVAWRYQHYDPCPPCGIMYHAASVRKFQDWLLED